MKKLDVNALLDYKFLSGIKASPEGKTAAFIVKQAKEDQKGYNSWVFVADTEKEEVRRLTSSGSESNMIYDDERTLLFSSVRKDADKPEKYKDKTVFYRISLDGGEAEEVFSLPFGVEKIEKISDGKYVFSATVDLHQPENDDEAQYHIIEEIPYWQNGAYFVSRFRTSLFVFDEKTGETEQITEPLFATAGFKVTDKSVYYTGAAYDDVLPMKNGLYRYDFASKKEETLIKAGEMSVKSFDVQCGENGDTVWFAGSMADKYGNSQYPDFYKFENGKLSFAAEYGNGVCTIAAGDTVLGGGSKMQFSCGHLHFVSMAGLNAEIYMLDAENKEVVKSVPFEGSVDCFAMTDDKVFIVGRENTKLSELYVYDKKTEKLSQFPSFNDEVIKDSYVCKPIYAGFTDSDGVKIDGYVILPKDYDPNKKYPGILDMHGGPRVAFGTPFFHEMQWLAGEGYFVFFCNPRGSDGRGDEFADLRGKYGTIDFKDFMEFTDHVLEKYPALDADRLGVTGGSYGGWMTNWIIGHTGRFAAAVSARSFSNFLSDFGASEIGFSFDVNENKGKTPWTAPADLWERSPVAYANRAATPTLFIHSLKDYNCPLSEGMQMFVALKYHGVPSKAFLIEGENHELSRSGKPINRLRRFAEMKAWFDRYLKTENA